jgi:hypothetical protein
MSDYQPLCIYKHFNIYMIVTENFTVCLSYHTVQHEKKIMCQMIRQRTHF